MRSATESAHAPRAAMDLLGQRWILRIVWELEPGPLGFLELRRRMNNCSSSMLSVRLQTLQSAGVVIKRVDKAYELTGAGSALARALEPVWGWAEAHLDSGASSESDR